MTTKRDADKYGPPTPPDRYSHIEWDPAPPPSTKAHPGIYTEDVLALTEKLWLHQALFREMLGKEPPQDIRALQEMFLKLREHNLREEVAPKGPDDARATLTRLKFEEESLLPGGISIATAWEDARKAQWCPRDTNKGPPRMQK